MPKQRKPKKNVPPPVKKRSRFNLLSVLYVIIAAAVVLSMMAGVFGGIAAPSVDPGATTGQTTGRDTGNRIPITVVPVSPTAVPTTSAP